MLLHIHKAIATFLQQILTQSTGFCLPRTMDQIIPNTKVEFVHRLEIRMARGLRAVALVLVAWQNHSERFQQIYGLHNE